MSARRSQPWTEHDVAELRRLWREGLRPPAIAAALGRTTSAVSWKACQLLLPPRVFLRGHERALIVREGKP